MLGPGMRADVLLDALGDPGSTHTVVDDFYPRQAYRLLDLHYGNRRDRGMAEEPWPRTAPNPLAEPDLANAQRHSIRFEGGMMGHTDGADGLGERSGRIGVDRERQARRGGRSHARAGAGTRASALLRARSGERHRMAPPDPSSRPRLRVLTRDGKPTRYREWADSVLLHPRSRAEIALVADNPGNWMLHCHVLEHQASGDGGKMAAMGNGAASRRRVQKYQDTGNRARYINCGGRFARGSGPDPGLQRLRRLRIGRMGDGRRVGRLGFPVVGEESRRSRSRGRPPPRSCATSRSSTPGSSSACSGTTRPCAGPTTRPRSRNCAAC